MENLKILYDRINDDELLLHKAFYTNLLERKDLNKQQKFNIKIVLNIIDNEIVKRGLKNGR